MITKRRNSLIFFIAFAAALGLIAAFGMPAAVAWRQEGIQTEKTRRVAPEPSPSVEAARRGSASVASITNAGDELWQDVDLSALAQSTTRKMPQAYRTLRLNFESLRGLLYRAPQEGQIASNESPVELSLPLPEGGFARFRIVESPIMEPALAAQFPEIKTYSGQGVDDPAATMRADLSPRGFHAMAISERGTLYIDPYETRGDSQAAARDYISYYRRDYVSDREPFQCFVQGDGDDRDASNTPGAVAVSNGATLRTYRLAMAATGEYTTYHGGTVQSALTAITTTINRVNTIYQRDLAIRLMLVAGEANIIYTNPNTDPYSGPKVTATLLGENQAALDAVIGSANYDVGHVFSRTESGGGGLGAYQAVCNGAIKAHGGTARTAPTGDPFDVDYVAHEIGHQLTAHHTFNGTAGRCSDSNRSAVAAYEPGSGSTVMAYAGICEEDDLQPNSDDYFHAKSLEQITAFVTQGGGRTCGVLTNTGNAPPTVSAGPEYTIPGRTPFTLTATGNDANGDALTFAWEQFDLGPAAPPGADNGSGPIYRSFAPQRTPSRTFPRLEDILAGRTTIGEAQPTTTRTLNFRVTARDNRPQGRGFSTADTRVNVLGDRGPFAVTHPNGGGTAVSWAAGSTQTVTWNVAGTSAAPINAATVKISLSTDGGQNFTSVLAESTPNDGNHAITVPNVSTNAARIKVEAVGNIFFAISAANFTITGGNQNPNVIALTSGAPQTGSIPAPTQPNPGVLGATQYSIQVPSGATQLQIELNGNQDVDLYARAGQPIAIADGRLQADFISETTTGNEMITVSPASSPALQAGAYYIAVGNFGPGAANFTVKATVTGGAPNNPVPALVSLTPNQAAAGSGGLQLTVDGSNFIGGSVVRWNNTDRQTTFVNNTTLMAAIPASDLATAGSASVTVFNPAPGGGTSAALAFTITGGAGQTEVLSADDGTAEVFFRDNGIMDVVRLTPSRYPARLQAVRIFVAAVQNSPNPVGAQIGLIAFAGAPGATRPANNPRLLLDQPATIPNFTSAGFVDFPIANGPTITEGDIYAGLRSNPANGVFAFFDRNGQQHGRSFYSVDNGATYEGPTGVPNPPNPTQPVNLMARAVMATGGGGEPNTPSIEVTPVFLDFGTVNIGSNAERTLTLRNTGAALLNVTGITSGSAQFKIVSPASFTVAPNGQQTATVRFSPNAAGNQSGTLTVASNDPVKAMVMVQLKGTGGDGGTQARLVRAGQSSGAPGGQVSVPIELVAQGDENALGFSLTFDPAALGKPQAATGNDAAGATLNTNASQLGQGRLGIALSLPFGQKFSAGARQIVVVSFTIAGGGTASSTPIGFGDQPVAREVSDTNANALPASYTPGAVTISTGIEGDVAPRLQGNGTVTVTDWVQIGRFVSGQDTLSGSEFQRADTAPRESRGSGSLTITDWVQAGRYAAGLDPLAPAGGPSSQGKFDLTTGSRYSQAGAASGARIVGISSGYFERGQQNPVIIELGAEGNENALGFSLNFDPAQLRFVSAAAGRDASGATLNLNTSQTKKGRIGLALALPAGQTIQAGQRQIMVINFAVATEGEATAATISFGDRPATRELSDANANSLPVNFTGGTVTLTRSVTSVDVMLNVDGHEANRVKIHVK